MSGAIRARRIAIVGAGASGVTALKYLLQEEVFKQVTVYEQSANVGGLWQATPRLDEEQSFTLPSTVPTERPERPAWISRTADVSSSDDSDRSADSSVPNSPATTPSRPGLMPAFVSPVYDHLETNIPHSLMRFSDHYFPEDIQLFPKHQMVQRYLEDYARDVRHHIKFETQVLDVRLHHTRQHDSEEYRDVWEVQSQDLRTSKHYIDTYDAVVCANGHYATPYVPAITGMETWGQKYPRSISHAKYYRRPDVYEGKKVLIVGNHASGSDISNQIIPYSKKPLLVSGRAPSPWSSLSAESSSPLAKKEVPPIAHLNAADGSILFEDGQKEYGVDAILFCTGYLYSYPFLQSLDPPLIKDGGHVNNTYQHIFYVPHASLTLPALTQMVIPFPIAEAQAAVIARYYAGRLSLPSCAEMMKWERQRQEEALVGGDTSRAAFHKLPYPADAHYMNMLCDWAASAETEGRTMKRPRKWGEQELWTRSNLANIKKAFNERGEQRHQVTSIEQLGFVFDWKREQWPS